MRFVVLGAGAVGGTIGGRLADAGHEVVLLARGEHAQVMASDGLRLAMPDRVAVVHPQVVSSPERLPLADDDVLILTTKSQDTAALLDALPRRDLPVLCAQNGVANERMALRRTARVYGVVVMLPAVFLEPGRIDAQGQPYSGLLDVGCYPVGADDTADEAAAALSASGFVSAATPDVMRWKHAKLLRNLGNALEALCGHDLDDDGMAIVRRLDEEAKAEATACFTAAGIGWASDEEWAGRRGAQVQWAPVEGRDRGGGSTWQSLARGLGSVEVDHLNGEIALLGRLHGVPTPVNEMLQRRLHALVRAGGAPGTVKPNDLVER